MKQGLRREQAEARLAEFFGLVAGGETVAGAARKVGVTKMTGGRWIAAERERAARAKEAPAVVGGPPLTDSQIETRLRELVGVALDYLGRAVVDERVPAQTRAQVATRLLALNGFTAARAEQQSADARAEAERLRKARDVGDPDPLEELAARLDVLTPGEREIVEELRDKVRRGAH